MEINPCEWIFLLAPNSCAFFCFFSLVPNYCNLFDTQSLRKFPWKSIAVGGFFRLHPTLANLQQTIPQSLRAFSLQEFSQIFFKTESLKTIPVHFSVVFSRLYPILANLLLLLLLQHPLPKNYCAKRTFAFLLQFLPPKFSIAIFFNTQFLEALKDTTIFFFFLLSPSNALHPFFHQMLLLFFIFF